MCAVCGAKITERRRVELSEAIESFSGKVALATFTAQHSREDLLKPLLSDFLTAWRWMLRHRTYDQIKGDYGILGFVRSLETTYGGANGFHPHNHVLYFCNGDRCLDGLESALTQLHIESLEHFSRSASWDRGCDVRTADSDVADYVTKFGRLPAAPKGWTVGHELTKSAVKLGHYGDHRTPAQLLWCYLWMNDRAAGAVWQEIALTFKGRHQLTWSRGLRKLIDLGPEESDQVIVERDKEDSVLLASLSLRQWQIILANDARGEVLQASASGDIGQLEDFLRTIGAYGIL